MALAGILVDPIDGVGPGKVRFENGVITAVERSGGAAAGERYVFPGFVDLQVYDYARTASGGVTGYLATIGPAPAGTVEAFLAGLPDGPACLGAHLEGPYVNPEAAGALAPDHVRPVDLAELERWLGTGRVRVVTLAPEVAGAFDAIDRIVAAGAVAAVGHTQANHYTTRAAVDRGASFATHVWNAMSGFRARMPGAAGTLLADERVTLGLIADGRHLHPVTEDVTFRVAGPARIALTSDLVPAPQETAEGRLLGGDRCGAALVARMAGRFGLAEAAQMASLTPASVLGLADRGRLVPGYRADLAVLGPDFEPLATIVGGETVYRV